MGKILKFCSSCEEGFAERFTFCPDCGGSLQAVELNPVEPVQAGAVEEPQAPAFITEEISEPVLELPNDEPTVDEVEFASAPTEEIPAVVEEPAVEEPIVAATQPAITRRDQAFMTAPGILFESEPRYADEVRHTLPTPILSKDDDGYSITVIEEKNGSQRNGLLLAATVFAVLVTVGAWGVSLFNKALDIGAIGDDRSIALLLDEVPMQVEEDPEPEKNDDEDGGGGGGGKEDPNPVDRGDLANQTKNPLRAPDATTYRSDDTELKLPPASTEGNKQFEQKYNVYGDPNAKYTGLASNGPGSGGGLGTGTGPGQGSGTGTGAGSGSGSGYGSGSGSGNGPGSGEGGAPPPRAAAVTQPLKITYKQKAAYTDAARTNGVQGTVTLRVTFLASGGIGSITTIKGLPHGLTEQAIAAARAMRFEPEMVGGQARTTTRPVTFSFNIY
jgi:TonB family protein